MVQENVLLLEVMRSLGAGWRALRLYPAASPMTGEAIERIRVAIEEYVMAEPSLKLDVMRGGFILRGIDDILTAPGVEDLADALASHGVGELHFVAPPETEEILVFLTSTQSTPDELTDLGGMQKVLARSNVGSIRIVPVVLQKIETPPEIPEEEADKFLAELAADAGRLAVWMRQLLASDDEGLAEGLRVLADAAGDVGTFGRTMAAAFMELDTGDKDRVFETAIDLEPVRDITTAMLDNITDIELTAALRGGRFGENIMALSYALTALPLGGRREAVVSETTQALTSSDTSEAQVALLDQMLRLRQQTEPEPALHEAHPEFATLRDAGVLEEEHIVAARQRARSRPRLDAGAVEAVFTVLDTTEDLRSCGTMLDAIARSVPHLLEVGDMDQAMAVSERMSRWLMFADKPWPELDGRFAQATIEAVGVRSMTALISLSENDERAVEFAKDLLSLGGETAAESLATAIVEADAENSMEFGEGVLGRRLPELIAPEAARVEANHAAKLAELLARDGSPRCIQALGDLLVRPEDQVRSRAARGIAAGGGTAFATLMPRLLRDPSLTVALVAVSAVAESSSPGTAAMLGSRLAELEGDSELPLAREIISALATSPDPTAEEALQAVIKRGGIIRKGKDSELKQLARTALQTRAGGQD